MEGLSKELEGVLAQVLSGHDVVPFMAQMLPAADAIFQPLPLDMLEVLRLSADYQSIRPALYYRPCIFDVLDTFHN